MPTRLPAAKRREQLLDVAMTEFAANGYHGTSMNHVAKAAGITKPVLYQHFASKRDLYVELVDDVADRLASQVLKSIHPTDSYFQITVNALSAYFSFVEQNERESFSFFSGAQHLVMRTHANAPEWLRPECHKLLLTF